MSCFLFKKIFLKLLLFFLLIFIFIFIFLIFFLSEKTIEVSLVNNSVFKLKENIDKEKLPEKEESISVILVGDIMLSREVERMIKKHKDYNFPFLKTRDYLETGDIVFGNLEGPIIEGFEVGINQLRLRAPPGVEKALKNANFSILSLANNHSFDYGEKGLLDTLNYLLKAGIRFVGAGKSEKEAYDYVILEKKGRKFAFLAYVEKNFISSFSVASGSKPGVAVLNKEKLKEAIAKAREIADFVIVSMHFGIEYQKTPSSFQREFAREAIDSGADIVVGHHPHVIQEIEKYKEGYIFYSLGNFIFDQTTPKSTKEGLMAKIVFKDKKLREIEITPVFIERFSQPRVLEGEEAKRVIDSIKTNF